MLKRIDLQLGFRTDPLLTALCGISGKVSPKWGHGLFGRSGAKQALLRSQHKMALLSVLRIG